MRTETKKKELVEIKRKQRIEEERCEQLWNNSSFGYIVKHTQGCLEKEIDGLKTLVSINPDEIAVLKEVYANLALGKANILSDVLSKKDETDKELKKIHTKIDNIVDTIKELKTWLETNY